MCIKLCITINEKTEIYYAEIKEQQVVDLLEDEDSISGNLGSIVAEYAIWSPDLDNSFFALEAAINGGSSISDRNDAVYNVQMTNSISSPTIHTTGDNIRVGTTEESKQFRNWMVRLSLSLFFGSVSTN